MNFNEFSKKIDLRPIKFKLSSKLTLVEIQQGEELYKMFLYLVYKYKDIPIVPTELIDEYWHAHILDTAKYMSDCEKLFGKYLHHFPYLGIRGAEDQVLLQKQFEISNRLFVEEFGVNPSLIMNHKESSICSSGCSHTLNSADKFISGIDFNTRPH